MVIRWVIVYILKESIFVILMFEKTSELISASRLLNTSEIKGFISNFCGFCLEGYVFSVFTQYSHCGDNSNLKN